MSGIVVHSYGGTVAAYDDMLQEAELVAHVAAEVADIAYELQRAVLAPDLAASAILNPAGAAKAEFELVDAVNGPRGLVTIAAALLVRGVALRTAVAVYRATDDELAYVAAVARWVGGVPGLPSAPSGIRWLRDLAGDPKEWVRYARLVDRAAGALPALLMRGRRLFPPFHAPGPITVKDAAALLALLWQQPVGRARSSGSDAGVLPAKNAPVGSLLMGLAVADAAKGTAGPPVVQIRRMSQRNGDGTDTNRWVVYLPGVESWHPSESDAPTHGLGAVHSVAGFDTAYQQAIMDALRQAEVPAGEPIMLVGHSFGGMVAIQSCDDLIAAGYSVTHVLTAGSPLMAYETPPPSVQVLSLENRWDGVTLTDGIDARVERNWTTVSLPGTGHHVTGGYVPYAKQIDAMEDPALRSWRDSSAGFFNPPSTSQGATAWEVYNE